MQRRTKTGNQDCNKQNRILEILTRFVNLLSIMMQGMPGPIAPLLGLLLPIDDSRLLSMGIAHAVSSLSQ